MVFITACSKSRVRVAGSTLKLKSWAMSEMHISVWGYVIVGGCPGSNPGTPPGL